MNTFTLTARDRVQDFEAGLAALGPIDCISEHRNARRRCLFAGRCFGWSNMNGREVPMVIDWMARIQLPAELADSPQAQVIEQILRHRISRRRGQWLVDIRTESRLERHANLAQLVREDIERGDLPNRLMFERGLHEHILPQIDNLRHRMAGDPAFNWKRVRVDLSA